MSRILEPNIAPIDQHLDLSPDIPDQSAKWPGSLCGGCDRSCPIGPFDDLLAYGVHCMSKPEDLHPEQWQDEANLWQWQR